MMLDRSQPRARSIEAIDVPRDELGRQMIGVRGLLEWAFGVEHAALDFDEVGAVAAPVTLGVGNEYRIMRQLELGKRTGEGVRVDTSAGRSHPHDDAELVASVLRNAVPWYLATRVAELARAGRTPRWDLGQQRLQPKAWAKKNHVGRFGKTEVYREVVYVSRGRRRVRKDLWVPCIWVPSASEIASAHRSYLDWWGALLAVRGGLKSVELKKFALTEQLPPLEPWKKTA